MFRGGMKGVLLLCIAGLIACGVEAKYNQPTDQQPLVKEDGGTIADGGDTSDGGTTSVDGGGTPDGGHLTTDGGSVCDPNPGCGQACGMLCGANKYCRTTYDCLSGVCQGDTCRAPTCYDGVRNGDELGVDCGNNACLARCQTGEPCLQASDCITNICTAAGTCT